MNPEASVDPEVTETELPWLRLDRRMLLIHPVEEILRLLPVLAGTVVLGTSSGNPYWGLAAAGVLVIVGLLRWFTTTYRIGPAQVELRRGLLQRQELSVPRSRIRSVDVDQRVLHRLLGLAVVKIGTGQSSGGGERNRFELNGLAVAAVPALRAALLAAGPDPVHAGDSPGTTDNADHPTVAETEIARLDPRWVRYAPFSATGLIGVAAVVGLAFQYGLGERLSESGAVERGVETLAAAGVVMVAAVVVIAVLIVASIAACVRYLLLYGNLRVTDDNRMLRIGHGLLRVRHTTLDRARLRGVNLREPLALRLVGAARLDAIMTGVAAERGESSLVLPSAPATEARRVAAAVLTDVRPVDVRLVPHGHVARRRRFTRAMLPAVAIVAVGLAVSVSTGRSLPPAVTVAVIAALLAGSAGLAWDRYRGLGHAVLPARLVTRGGSLDRQRICLDADGIIGWTVRQSYFQRRSGVATLVAATPAGAGHYDVVDIPVEQAWALVESVTPGIGDIWRRR